jgi:hypothetical protein
MFYGATSFDQDVSAWSITAVNATSNLQNMWYNTPLSTYHYNQLLIAWAAQNPLASINL